MDDDAFQKAVKEHRDEFYRMIGHCVTRWAFVDRTLFSLCHICLGTTPEQTALVFYKFSSINDHKLLAGNLIKITAKPDRDINKQWADISSVFEKLIPFRNFIVHNPVRGGANKTSQINKDGTHGKAIVSITNEIYIEGGKLYNKDVLPEINKADFNDLKDHYLSVEEMNKKLCEFEDYLSKKLGNDKAPFRTGIS
jgi:hypothetical protein